MTENKLIDQAEKVFRSIALDKRLAFYGLVLLGLHTAGILLLYDLVPEFDIVNHFWFGYVLSEYSSVGANAVSLQLHLTERFQKCGWAKAKLRQVDFLFRLASFLLIGGLFWEWTELSFSHILVRVPDSFFAFPITLSNIDGAVDVAVGVVGASVAFLLEYKANNLKGK